MTLPKAIICDIDGVLADHRHRLHFVDLDYVPKCNHWVTGSEEDIPWPSCKDRFSFWKCDYEAFHAAIDKDIINHHVEEIITRFGEWISKGKEDELPFREIIFVTGRSEKYRGQTKAWLYKCDTAPYTLFMRPDFTHEGRPDHRPSHVVKREIYEREIKGKYEVLFAMDDNEECCQMYKSLGITTLKVM
jgi:hypothetical protein